jgi:surfactin synthase thioesterase subunit
MRSLHRFIRRSAHLIEMDYGLSKSNVLVGFGHAGAGTSWITCAAAALNADWGICVALLPGRERRLREPEPMSIVASAEQIAEEVESLRLPLKRRFVLFGQSLGGLLAFETCRHLERNGTTQALVLVALGTPAPNGPPPLEEESAEDSELLARLGELGGLAPQFARPWLPALRSDMRLFSEYPWGSVEPISSNIIAMRGVDDTFTPADWMLPWEKCTKGPEVQWVSLPGGHLPTHACFSRLVRMLTELDQITHV